MSDDTYYEDELDADLDPANAAYAGSDVETILHRVADLIGNARPMPLSASVMINRDEVLELVEEALSRLPEELRAARWLLREREEFLAKVQREGDDILDAARVRAERMVQRTEVVRNAQHTARQVIDDAETEARRLKHEAEDFCDQKLAQFEIVLDRTIRTVQAGRARLQAALPEDPHGDADPAGGGAPEPEFFDQDDL
jgi:F0F1-type ATP synthase membrane subunit b/b'